MSLGDDVLFLSAAELGPRIRRREISPVELTEACLDRIARLDSKLNAFAFVMTDQAREAARTAEREIEAGRYRGPLHGIPWGAKDLLATQGTPTTWGARPCRSQRFDFDATVVRRLRQAGAVLLGKLAMVEFAGCCDSSLQGPGRNPWDTARWTGGSSSGAGAAVASGLVTFAIGTETWGSILCPSAFCGITGLRPTYGRVSRFGGMVGSWTFDKIGPLTRSAADCRLVLSVIAGTDPDDPSSSLEPVALGPRRRSPKGTRAALIPTDFAKTKGAEREVGARFDEALEALRGLGISVEEAKLPDLPVAEAASVLITAEALSTFERFYRDGTVRQLRDPYAPWQPEINRAMTGADLMKAWRVRHVVQEQMADFYGRWDVIVSPNFLSVAPPVDRDLYETLPYPDPVGAVGNACGLPAIALPCGFGKDHLPAGFQIIGAPWDEGLLCDLGEAYQRATTFHRERPPIA
ncbi:MAG: amidase [Candidatus Eisenbacteria bacterium]|uniref:Amidase n=1 Tax=Eiseniibacteriota bacterium TaxID=2212470 RepID=A0A538U0E9_UNCEI|nr:MAG: amidase [Candidatus Eisenbacteria bacterium]